MGYPIENLMYIPNMITTKHDKGSYLRLERVGDDFFFWIEPMIGIEHDNTGQETYHIKRGVGEKNPNGVYVKRSRRKPNGQPFAKIQSRFRLLRQRRNGSSSDEKSPLQL